MRAEYYKYENGMLESKYTKCIVCESCRRSVDTKDDKEVPKGWKQINRICSYGNSMEIVIEEHRCLCCSVLE
jgi:predicted metal-binding protein